MSDPFVGEIRMVGFNFAPRGWAQCNGQLMPISQNTALFSLLGTFYGGDGKSTFALPNLEGSAPMNQGQGPGLTDRSLGEIGGSPSVTVLNLEMPVHTHLSMTNGEGATSANPQGMIWTDVSNLKSPPYGPPNNLTLMNPIALSLNGGSQPHNNMQPFLVNNFIIALQGIFPPRS
jgi:microcystin-dependent protein